MSVYYVGKWNDHVIIVENQTEREKLIVDNEVLVQTKSGLRFGSALTAPMPGTDDLYIYVMIEGGTGCSCLIGKPLETEYDKKTKCFTAEYNGHTIEAFNKSKSYLVVDGQEVDREPEGLHSFGIRGSQPDADGKRFMSVHDGVTNGLKVKCSVYAEAENVRMIPCKKQGGELIPLAYTGDDAETAALLACLMVCCIN